MPATINDIELHVRSYRSALKSNLEITINSLTHPYLRLESILHPAAANQKNIDFSALLYSVLRLPSTIESMNLIVMGQNTSVFCDNNYDISSWAKYSAPARRRTHFINKNQKIDAALIGSISDVDDLVNLLIAFQVEWNKFHHLLSIYPTYSHFKKACLSKKILIDLKISSDDWIKFLTALGPYANIRLRRLYEKIIDFRIRLLAGSWIDYTKTVQKWWKHAATTVSNSLSSTHLSHSRIYFVSSNSHSLLNLFTGFPHKIKPEIIPLLKRSYPDLYNLYQQIQTKNHSLPEPDFLFYSSKFFNTLPHFQKELLQLQKQLEIVSISSPNFLDVNIQIFPLKNIAHSHHLSPQISIKNRQKLAKSDALIINIDYPLGFAAYHILNEILENVSKLEGLYILGKAAVLNSELGDIEIPKVVFDEHTQNTYLFNNCFNSFFPFPNHQGSILTNQKAVSVLSAFLENEALFKKYFDNNITVIEMESGPYLSAVCEATYDQQFPDHSIVDLHSAPFDIGIINYTSDTPYSKAKNLGTGSLELNGAEPVYLGTLSILQRIIEQEENKA